MDQETDNLRRNHTWDLTQLPRQNCYKWV